MSILEIEKQSNEAHPIKWPLVANSRGVTSDFPDHSSLPFVPSSFFISNTDIAQRYDKIDYDGKGGKVLKKYSKFLIPQSRAFVPILL